MSVETTRSVVGDTSVPSCEGNVLWETNLSHPMREIKMKEVLQGGARSACRKVQSEAEAGEQALVLTFLDTVQIPCLPASIASQAAL